MLMSISRSRFFMNMIRSSVHQTMSTSSTYLKRSSSCAEPHLLKIKMEDRLLVAFDFDDTMIDANSDLVVQKLSPTLPQIPAEINALRKWNGWIDFMDAVFGHLHDHGVVPTQILDCMAEIPLVAHMRDLLLSLSASKYSDVIIISDSNSVFIDHILKMCKLDNCINKVYTNPARFDSTGRLKLDKYHTQDWCNLSSVNLCKGHVLTAHIDDAAKRDVRYNRIAYVGDGSNDLCPSLRLCSNDIVFPRKGFSLIKKIEELEGDRELRAKIVPWATGMDILSELKLSVNRV